MGEHPDADLLSTGMLNEFYGMLLQSEDRYGGNSLLDGPLWKKENAGKTIYELLAYNESQRKQFENNTMGRDTIRFLPVRSKRLAMNIV